MLVSLVEVVCCENPKCRDFAKPLQATQGVNSHYCPLCGSVSYPRVVDAQLASSSETFKAYLQRTLDSPEPLAIR